MSLTALPAEFDSTRDALHQVAFFAVSPARYRAVGRMGLRAAPGGFGTPEFEGRVARVEGDQLVHEQDGNIATQSISTVRAAAEFFGVEYDPDWFPDFHDPLIAIDPDVDLDVDEGSALALGQWFDFGTGVLDELRSLGKADDDVSEVQLWPEHFDPATELGSQEAGKRASYGASPGDQSHAEPYLYVAAWGEIDRSDPYWNDTTFNGASLSYEELLGTDDPESLALEFLLDGYRRLAGR